MTCTVFLLSRANLEILVHFTDCKTKAQKGERGLFMEWDEENIFYQLAPAATEVENAAKNLEVSF